MVVLKDELNHLKNLRVSLRKNLLKSGSAKSEVVSVPLTGAPKRLWYEKGWSKAVILLIVDESQVGYLGLVVLKFLV